MNNQDFFLNGEKIALKGLEESDLELIHNWLNDSDVTRLLFQGDRPKNLGVMKEEFQNRIKSNENIEFAIITKNEKKIIGWAGLYEINWISRNGEIRFFIGEKEFWKKGHTTEVVSLLIEYAFNKLNLHKVWGGANIENVGSIRVFEKLKFFEEGIIKEGHFRNGQYYDLIRYGLLNKKEN